MKLNFGSYNIAHGRNVNFDMTVFAQNILSQDLDIIGFQEVDRNTERSRRIDQMRDITEKTGYGYGRFYKTIPLGSGEYGLGILSKYPITESERIELDSDGTREQRILARAAIDVNGTEVNFFVTHLSHESKATRTRQFAQLAKILAEYDNFILTGDFNTADLTEYEVIAGAATVNNSQFSVVTFPEKSSTIDNIVYSTNTWRFDKPQTVTDESSDHYLLYATGALS